jgi:glycosyltransferase involved in cell wall biosynthesis
VEAHGVVDEGPAYSIIVPVRNEASVLARTIPALLAATGADNPQIIYVCNGCTDDSAALACRLLGRRGRVISLERPGKTHALNHGDAVATAFPRFYVDADVLPAPGSLGRMAGLLRGGEIEVIAPLQRYDVDGITRVARAICRMAEALPHGQHGGLHCCIGLSQAGRARWGSFPDLLGDDIFIEASVPKDRQLILHDEPLLIRAPHSFSAWVRVRLRWREGERQLERIGLRVARTPGQARALIRALFRRQTCFDAACYLAARAVAEVLLRWPRRHGRSAWFSVAR